MVLNGNRKTLENKKIFQILSADVMCAIIIYITIIFVSGTF